MFDKRFKKIPHYFIGGQSPSELGAAGHFDHKSDQKYTKPPSLVKSSGMK
jgi:hypothetical protein